MLELYGATAKPSLFIPQSKYSIYGRLDEGAVFGGERRRYDTLLDAMRLHEREDHWRPIMKELDARRV